MTTFRTAPSTTSTSDSDREQAVSAKYVIESSTVTTANSSSEGGIRVRSVANGDRVVVRAEDIKQQQTRSKIAELLRR